MSLPYSDGSLAFLPPLSAVRTLPLPSATWNPPPPQVEPSSSSALSVPKELWRMVDFIYRAGLHEKDLFIQPGTWTMPAQGAAGRHLDG
jgi:hypothetical protein